MRHFAAGKRGIACKLKLAVADRQIAEGNVANHEDVMQRLKERIHNG